MSMRRKRARHAVSSVLQRTVAGLLLLPLGTSVAGQQGCPDVRTETETTSPLTAQAKTSDPSFTPREQVVDLHACLIEARDVLADQAQYVLVDVRPPGEVARQRIHDALNLLPADVANSPFIPRDGKRVVLVGEGPDLPRLLRICADLSTGEGPMPQVLTGGVRAWHRAGGHVAGDIAGLEAPQAITATGVRELLRLPGAWLVTDAKTSPSDIEAGTLIHVAGRGPDAMAQHLRTRARSNTPLAIVALLDQQADQAAWRQLLLSVGLPEPMFYPDGIDAYARWTRQQIQMAEHAGRSLDTGCRWN